MFSKKELHGCLNRIILAGVLVYRSIMSTLAVMDCIPVTRVKMIQLVNLIKISFVCPDVTTCI